MGKCVRDKAVREKNSKQGIESCLWKASRATIIFVVDNHSPGLAYEEHLQSCGQGGA